MAWPPPQIGPIVICGRCRIPKPRKEFYTSRQTRSGVSSWCKICHRSRSRSWTGEKKAQRKKWAVGWKNRLGESFYVRKNATDGRERERRRDETFKRYGGKCVCCGETNYAFLTIDCVNGSGRHKMSQGKYGIDFYRWLRRNGYPYGYQTMCFNCNWAKHRYGVCPHQSKKPEAVA